MFEVRLLPGLPRLPREDGGERGGDRPVRTREEQVQRRLEAESGQNSTIFSNAENFWRNNNYNSATLTTLESNYYKFL